ncbi:N-acetylneuraminate lyase [Piscirickettsia salmonis]|uniref:N-acetylneuraminate lyase n=3 Tax=Piscirickettsia salmonis TaxID=1238 RepID=UPI0012BAA2E6|nr:N-acetylneuraminate lyase [Piscirickettsia salmonis]
MMSKNFQGIYLPLMTPFHEDGSLALDKLANMMDYQINKGVAGFYVGGSSGEGFLLSEAERAEVIKVAAEVNQQRVGMIAHVGVISTDLTAQLADVAVKAGYDAISATPPFYYAFSQEEIHQHYVYLAEQCPLPLLLYNIPGTTGISFNVEQLLSLMEHPRIIGLKHTTTDMFLVEQLRQRSEDAVIFHGEDSMLSAGLFYGANGGIGSTYNIMSASYIKLYEHAQCGEMDEALKLQHQVNHVTDAILKIGLFQSLKYLMQLRGVDYGVCRKPFLPLTKEKKQALEQLMDNNPCLN